MTTPDARLSANRLHCGARGTLAVIGLALLAGGAQAAPDGKDVFLAQKCNTCHSVPAAGVEATVKIEKMKGPALPTASMATDVERQSHVVRQEELIDGKKHPKKFSGSDEELAALFGWLGQLAAEPAPGASGE